MAISLHCPVCGALLKVKDELAGKRGKCPKCQGAVQIPAQVAGAVAGSAAAMRPQAKVPGEVPADFARGRSGDRDVPVLEEFAGKIDVPKEPLSFRLRMLAAAVAICLLPALYTVLILLLLGGGIGWLIYSPQLIGSGDAGGIIVRYGPAVLLLLVGLALFKPLLAPQPSKGKLKVLARDKAPLLFELVDKIATALDAEGPGQIVLDCNPALRGDASRLLIGMPLAAGVSVEQLAGMIAHECGRHLRGNSPRATAFVRGISGFFFRAVRERDTWDEAVHAATTRRGKVFGKLLWPLRLLFGLVKVLLWPLMYLGQMISGLLLQKTEFNADQCQIRLVGSGPFEATFRALRVIDFAWQQVQADLAFQHKENQLPDNLPRQLESAIAQVPDEFRSSLAASADLSDTADFALTPAEKDRLAAAGSAATIGIYRCPLPSTVLFSDFDALAKDVTWDFYLDVLGPPLERRFLHPVV